MHQDDPKLTRSLEAAILLVAQQRGGLFTFPESLDLLRQMGHDPGRRWLQATLDDLVARGSALRIERGSYALADGLGRVSPLALGGFLAPDAYASLWSAAWHYGFTTQDVATTSVITPVKKPPVAIQALQASFVFHQTDRSRVFGWHEESVDGVFARLADRERVLIDLLYFAGRKGVPRGAQIRAIWEEAAKTVNPFVLVDFTKRLRSAALSRRVGFLMDEFGLGPTEELLAWRTGNRHLIPLFKDESAGSLPSSRWGIVG